LYKAAWALGEAVGLIMGIKLVGYGVNMALAQPLTTLGQMYWVTKKLGSLLTVLFAMCFKRSPDSAVPAFVETVAIA
jgi:hypothetical protein